MIRFLRKLFGQTAPQTPAPADENSHDPSMKYLIVGLGNIGAEYHGTRHNVGFDVVDHLAAKHEATWKTETLGDVARFRAKGRTFVLLKPSTYMNRSGKATRYWLEKEKLDKDRLLVIVDDLAIDFGMLRMRAKGSPGSHNGLKDIDQVCGGGNYARLRIGIGADFAKGRQVDFVLGKWSDDELGRLPEVLAKAAEATVAFGTIGLARTMNQFTG